MTFPNEGKLGFTLHHGAEHGEDHVVETGGPCDNPEAVAQLRDNDLLKAIAGHSVEGMNLLREVVPLLQHSSRPLVMTFERVASQVRSNVD